MAGAEILRMRVTADVMAALDNLRRMEPDLPSRTEMVRRLIDRARFEMRRADYIDAASCLGPVAVDPCEMEATS